MLTGFNSTTGLGAPVEVVNGALRVTSGAATVSVVETLTATTLTAAATAVVIAAANTNRRTLSIMNTGTGTLYVGFANTVAAANGLPVAPASGALGQGGSYEWQAGFAPTGAIYAFSTAGTTCVVKEGV